MPLIINDQPFFCISFVGGWTLESLYPICWNIHFGLVRRRWCEWSFAAKLNDPFYLILQQDVCNQRWWCSEFSRCMLKITSLLTGGMSQLYSADAGTGAKNKFCFLFGTCWFELYQQYLTLSSWLEWIIRCSGNRMHCCEHMTSQLRNWLMQAFVECLQMVFGCASLRELGMRGRIFEPYYEQSIARRHGPSSRACRFLSMSASRM